MTSKELREIELRAKAASPGPWGGYHLGLMIPGGRIGNNGYGWQVQCWKKDEQGRPVVFAGIADCVNLDGLNDEANAEFIAHAREDVPKLVRQVRKLSRENAGLRATAARKKAR
jgi:hypothetical protein